MSNFYVGEVLFETGGTIDTPGDINVTAICDCSGSTGTAGQLLSSTGTALEWIIAPSGAPSATPTVQGILFGRSDSTDCNAAVGYCALGCLTSGSVNVALGAGALGALQDGGVNVAVGYLALSCSVSDSFNTALGYGAMECTNGGSQNVAVGNSALNRNVTGWFNTAVGDGALVFYNGGCYNVAVGNSSMSSYSSGACNTAIGYQSLRGSNSTGSSNVGVGVQAGCNISSGCLNVAIGPFSQVASPTGSCQLAIGFSTTDNWLTGTSTKAIKPGAGIIDCAGSCGTVGQVLCSNGANAIQWATPQTSPFITYTTSAVSYTAGTPLLVAIWGGGTIQGTINLDLVGYGGFQSYWNIFLSGDPTNFNTGWNQTDFYPPTSSGVSQGTWSVDFPVYPDPNANQWMIYFNPTQNALNPSPFTFFYRLLSGSNPNWQI